MPQAERNLMLSALSLECRKQILSKSVEVSLPLREKIFVAHETPHSAYFIQTGLASVVASTADGGTAEVGAMGRESVTASFHLLGPLQSPTDCVMQMGGSGLRIPFGELQRIFATSEEFRSAVLRQVQEQGFTTSQIAGCHRLHEAEQRLARWLLMVQDRTGDDVLTMTQEYVAEMLGTRRTTVTMVAGELQRNGIIQYRRGQVRILDRKALERAACDCYRVTRELYRDAYGTVEVA